MRMITRVIAWLVFGRLPRAQGPKMPPISPSAAERLCLAGSIGTAKRSR